MISSMHSILGTPTWPNFHKLPYYFSGLSGNKENRLKSIVSLPIYYVIFCSFHFASSFQIKCAQNVEIHLMKQMLMVNPMDRISAKQILMHQYFLNFNVNLRVSTILWNSDRTHSVYSDTYIFVSSQQAIWATTTFFDTMYSTITKPHMLQTKQMWK